MRVTRFLTITFLFYLAIVAAISAQFTSQELAERPRWEKFLKNSKLVKDEQPWGTKEAVTEPFRLTLERDGTVRQAIWKNASGRIRGYLENWRWEIAAYRLDKHLKLYMIPPTVERRFKGDRGSCQLLIDSKISFMEKEVQGLKVPEDKLTAWNHAVYLQRAFDNLIANDDRHGRNIRITEDWRVILIDHSRSFRTTKKLTKNLIYDEKNKAGPKLMKQMPRDFVEKLKALDFEKLQEIVDEYLTKKEINAVLLRRDLILAWLNKRISELGEAEVLYDR
jgi:hypothetical protein